MSQPLNSMNVKDAIFGRRSVRAYDAEQIGRPTLNVLLEAAVRAPTAMHAEPWQFVIVQDTKLLKRIADLAKVSFAAEATRLHSQRASLSVFTQPDFNVFYDAPSLIVICAKSAG